MWAVLPISGNDGGFILGERGWLLIEEGIEFRMEIGIQDGKGHGVDGSFLGACEYHRQRGRGGLVECGFLMRWRWPPLPAARRYVVPFHKSPGDQGKGQGRKLIAHRMSWSIYQSSR